MNTENGYTCSFILNTKGSGTPQYLLEFFKEVHHISNYIIEISEIFDASPQKHIWAAHMKVEEKDTLIQCVMRLNYKVDEKEFLEYSQRMCEEYMLEYIIGCGFDIYGYFMNYYTPSRFHNIMVDRGNYSVIFKEQKSVLAFPQILNNVFGMTLQEIEMVEGRIKKDGFYKVKNVFDLNGVALFNELMHNAGIEEYEIK